MAKVLLVNGSPHENGCVSTAMDEIISTLNQNGIETEKLWLGVKPMADCIACGQCEDACPQRLPIISYLEMVGEKLGN
jgi:multimeric flavodoxin WrbA